MCSSRWTEAAEGSQVRQLLAFLEIILLLHRHPPAALRCWARARRIWQHLTTIKPRAVNVANLKIQYLIRNWAFFICWNDLQGQRPQILEGDTRNWSFSFSVDAFEVRCAEECSRCMAISMEFMGSALAWRTQEFGKCTEEIAWKCSS